MATITGLTAARMEAIEAASVVDGSVVGDNLILERFDTTTIDAGSVRGPTGSPGVTTGELADVFASLMPVGSIVDYIGVTPPANWLTMTGQTIVDGQTAHPDLWAVLPASMKSGSNIVMPNTKGKVSVGYDSADTDFDTIGETGGSKTHTLTQAQLPAVTLPIDPPSLNVSIDPPATAVTGNTGNTGSDVTMATDAGSTLLYPAPGNGVPGGAAAVTPHAHPAGTLAVDIAPFNVAVNIPQFQSPQLGSGNSHPIVQPYVTFMKIIKAL